jgi:annexin A13
MGTAASIVGSSNDEQLIINEAKNVLSFIAKRDAQVLDKACTGLGTNDQLLINLICGRTKKQLFDMEAFYRQIQRGRSLDECIDSECGGNYGAFLKFVCIPRGACLLNQLNKAMSGIGCNKKKLNEIMCLSSTNDINGMKESYKNANGGPLSERIRKELNGEHETIILHLLANGRDHSNVYDENKAMEQARHLKDIIENGSGMMGGMKDEAKVELVKYIISIPPTQCQAVQGKSI